MWTRGIHVQANLTANNTGESSDEFIDIRLLGSVPPSPHPRASHLLFMASVFCSIVFRFVKGLTKESDDYFLTSTRFDFGFKDKCHQVPVSIIDLILSKERQDLWMTSKLQCCSCLIYTRKLFDWPLSFDALKVKIYNK